MDDTTLVCINNNPYKVYRIPTYWLDKYELDVIEEALKYMEVTRDV